MKTRTGEAAFVANERRKSDAFAFDQQDFVYLQQLVKRKSGIILADDKQVMAYSRLTGRLRELNLTRFRDYFDLIDRPGSNEIDHCLDAISTNLTSFFREQHHFTFIRDVLVPEARKQTRRANQLRIWSAGCSSGEEAYSIAITIAEALPARGSWNIEIIGTDLDRNMVNRAQQGRYQQRQCQPLLSPAIQQRYFKQENDYLVVKNTLKSMVSFSRLNLLDPWPAFTPFDMIVCRNVMIYFDKPTQEALINRYHRLLRPNGYLLIGHSEKITNPTGKFTSLGRTIYQRNG